MEIIIKEPENILIMNNLNIASDTKSSNTALFFIKHMT